MYHGVPLGEGTSLQDAYMFYKNVFIFLHKTHLHEDCNTMFIKSRWFCEEARVVYHVSGSRPDLVRISSRSRPRHL